MVHATVVLCLCITLLASLSDAFVCRTNALADSSISALHASAAGESIVERCYSAWNERNMIDAAACFDNDFTYDDGQYLGAIRKKSELGRLFRRSAEALPTNSVIVVDHIAISDISDKIGTQWHVEREDGSVVPFTRGCSFYTIDKKTGLIKTGFRVSEMIVKPNKQFSDAMVNSASTMMQMGGLTTSTSESGEAKSGGSIIETYFNAWNRRDMEAALACFVDDCLYETEDPVFVDEFRGKEALREHLLRNADVLPSACEIILDDLAIDSDMGRFGVKWHLEANGAPIPNLRGCSMYTTDNLSGLLRTGFDVTESPVKLPGIAQDVLALPLGKFLFSA